MNYNPSASEFVPGSFYSRANSTSPNPQAAAPDALGSLGSLNASISEVSNSLEVGGGMNSGASEWVPGMGSGNNNSTYSRVGNFSAPASGINSPVDHGGAAGNTDFIDGTIGEGVAGTHETGEDGENVVENMVEVTWNGQTFFAPESLVYVSPEDGSVQYLGAVTSEDEAAVLAATGGFGITPHGADSESGMVGTLVQSAALDPAAIGMAWAVGAGYTLPGPLPRRTLQTIGIPEPIRAHFQTLDLEELRQMEPDSALYRELPRRYQAAFPLNKDAALAYSTTTGSSSGSSGGSGSGSGSAVEEEWGHGHAAAATAATAEAPLSGGAAGSAGGAAGGSKSNSSFGYPSSLFKVEDPMDGQRYVLRRFDNVRTTSAIVTSTVSRWQEMRHAGLVSLYDISLERRGGALFFTYAYYPGALTLKERFIDQRGALLAESLVWRITIQLLSAIRYAHNRRVAVRAVEPKYVILTSGTCARISCVGILDVIEFETRKNLAELQQDDLTKLGRLVLSLVTRAVVTQKNTAEALVVLKQHYSTDLQRCVSALLGSTTATAGGVQGSSSRMNVTQVCHLLSDRIQDELDTSLAAADALQSHLRGEYENGRLLRLLFKLGFINERPSNTNMGAGAGAGGGWSETGDQYVLKLFRDYVFHQVEERQVTTESTSSAANSDTRKVPVLDAGHVLTCLNKLDAGDPEEILLSSRDGKDLLVVSYADIQRCLETSFLDLVRQSSPSQQDQQQRQQSSRGVGASSLSSSSSSSSRAHHAHQQQDQQYNLQQQHLLHHQYNQHQHYQHIRQQEQQLTHQQQQRYQHQSSRRQNQSQQQFSNAAGSYDQQQGRHDSYNATSINNSNNNNDEHPHPQHGQHHNDDDDGYRNSGYEYVSTYRGTGGGRGGGRGGGGGGGGGGADNNRDYSAYDSGISTGGARDYQNQQQQRQHQHQPSSYYNQHPQSQQQHHHQSQPSHEQYFYDSAGPGSYNNTNGNSGSNGGQYLGEGEGVEGVGWHYGAGSDYDGGQYYN